MAGSTLDNGTKANNMEEVFISMQKENRSMASGNMERESDGLIIDLLKGQLETKELTLHAFKYIIFLLSLSI